MQCFFGLKKAKAEAKAKQNSNANANTNARSNTNANYSPPDSDKLPEVPDYNQGTFVDPYCFCLVDFLRFKNDLCGDDFSQ